MSAAGDAAGVERPHGQLRARLADRLGGDDAHRVADLDHLAGGQGERRSTPGTRRSGPGLEHGADGDLLGAGGDEIVELLAPDGWPSEAMRRRGCRSAARLVDDDEVDRPRRAQSGSRTMTSWATSTRRRVQVAGVRGTGRRVEDTPRRRASRCCSSTSRPSPMKLALIRRGMISPFGLDMSPRGYQLTDLLEQASRTGVVHHVDGVPLVEVLQHRVGDDVGGLVPLGHDRVVLVLGRQGGPCCSPPRSARPRRRTGRGSRPCSAG